MKSRYVKGKLKPILFLYLRKFNTLPFHEDIKEESLWLEKRVW